MIGLSLVPSAVRNMAGGVGSKDFGSLSNLLLSFGVLALILILNRFFSGFLRSLSVLIGIVAGTIAAVLMGKVNFTNFNEASWLHIPTPFYFGMPTFEIGPILTMILVCLVIIIESTGVFLALGKLCDRELTEKDFTKGYRAEGIAIVLGGLFNAFPYNTFAQNVGLVQLSKVKQKCSGSSRLHSRITGACSENSCFYNHYSHPCFRRSNGRVVRFSYFIRHQNAKCCRFGQTRKFADYCVLSFTWPWCNGGT